MAELHVVIDEKAIYESLLLQLDEKYILNFVDYRDEISAENFARVLKEGVWIIDVSYNDQTRYYAVQELNALLDKQVGLSYEEKELFKTTREYDELIFEIEDRNDANPAKEVFVKSDIHARVMLHSNYDCWLPIWENDGLNGKDDALEGMMKMLCLNPKKVKEEALRQGISCHRAFPNLKYREGKEIVSYEGFINCLRECGNYGLWTFFGKFDMEALWDTGLYEEKEDRFDSLVIPKGTTCTVFNDWNGGGSLEFTETIRPVTIAELKKRGETLYDCPRVYIDEKYKDARGYSSGEVYGGSIGEDTILCNAA